MRERDVIFLLVFSSSDINQFSKVIFDPDNPELSQRSPLYLLGPGAKHDTYDNGVC